ncbi:MAG: hypothetical protein V1906_01890 [Candidatus Woesearchaeota archaeon]
MEKIIEGIKRLEQVVEREMPNIKAEVRRMIKEKETSTKKIETMLDTLLNLAYMGKAGDEFLMLNTYYSGINKANAEFYTHCYHEITYGL